MCHEVSEQCSKADPQAVSCTTESCMAVPCTSTSLFSERLKRERELVKVSGEALGVVLALDLAAGFYQRGP